MTREFVRRSCGHGETVYAVGPYCGRHRRIQIAEKDLCGICREKKKSSEREALAAQTEKNARNTSHDQTLSGEVRDILKERNTDNQ
ncbi:MAG: hypothetical protein ACYCT9_10270 [Leptospirillum sp.]